MTDFIDEVRAKAESDLAATMKAIQESKDPAVAENLLKRAESQRDFLERCNKQTAQPSKADPYPFPNEEARQNSERSNTREYREAFKRYVQTGAPIPRELRTDGPTVSSEISALIPKVIMDEVVRPCFVPFGELYNRVRKMNVPSGIQFPVSSISATWTWHAEADCPNPQKAGDADSYITFNAYLGCAPISSSLVANIQALPEFEREIALVIREAFYKGMDLAIMSGSGAGEPLGILNDTRVTKTATFTEDEAIVWENWNKKVWRQVPIDKRDGYLIVGNSTMYNYMYNIKDGYGNPAFNATLDARKAEDGVEGMFMGKRVLVVPDELLGDFGTIEDGEPFAVYATLRDYVVNHNGAFGLNRYYDNKCHRYVVEGLAVVDGKVVNPCGFIVIKKEAPTT